MIWFTWAVATLDRPHRNKKSHMGSHWSYGLKTKTGSATTNEARENIHFQMQFTYCICFLFFPIHFVCMVINVIAKSRHLKRSYSSSEICKPTPFTFFRGRLHNNTFCWSCNDSAVAWILIYTPQVWVCFLTPWKTFEWGWILVLFRLLLRSHVNSETGMDATEDGETQRKPTQQQQPEHRTGDEHLPIRAQDRAWVVANQSAGVRAAVCYWSLPSRSDGTDPMAQLIFIF